MHIRNDGLDNKLTDLQLNIEALDEDTNSRDASERLERLVLEQEHEIKTLTNYCIEWKRETQAEMTALCERFTKLAGPSDPKLLALRHGKLRALPNTCSALTGSNAHVVSPIGSETTTTDTDHEADGRVRPSSLTPDMVANSPPQLDPWTLAVQGSQPLEQYLENGSRTVPTLLQDYEKRLCKSFVAGIAEQGYRSVLEERLQRVGWTWQNVQSEMRPMLSKGERMLRGGKVRGAL